MFVDGDGKPVDNAEWIFDPDLTAVVGFENKYWNIAGSVVSLMSQAERDAVDAAELSDRRGVMVEQMDEVEEYARAFALVVLDEINLLRTQHSIAPRTIAQLKTAVRNKLGS